MGNTHPSGDPENKMEILFSRSLLHNTQKTKQNTEKKKFGFLMAILLALLAWKISFLTYILHSSYGLVTRYRGKSIIMSVLKSVKGEGRSIPLFTKLSKRQSCFQILTFCREWLESEAKLCVKL